MKSAHRISELEAELSTLKMDLAQQVARIRGHETQIPLPRAGVEGRSELASPPRTEGILSVPRIVE